MGDKRDNLLKTTYRLVEKQGYHATGLKQIIHESGAPKGSLYYYFPHGKEELVAEALMHCGHVDDEHRIRVMQRFAEIKAAHEAIPFIITELGKRIETSNWELGAPIATVALETATSSERINAACQAIYRHWQTPFEYKLLENGFSKTRASALAMFIVMSIEGAIILSRTNHNREPFIILANELSALLKTTAKII